MSDFFKDNKIGRKFSRTNFFQSKIWKAEGRVIKTFERKKIQIFQNNFLAIFSS